MEMELMRYFAGDSSKIALTDCMVLRPLKVVSEIGGRYIEEDGC